MSHASVLKRALLASSLLGAALALAACGDNSTVYSMKTPTVASQAVTRDVAFGPDQTLPPQDATALRAFLASLRLDYGARVTLDDPHPEGAAARRAAISAIVAESGGVLTNEAPPAGADMPAGTARLWIERAQAYPPACPDWSSNPSANMNASTHSNFGCSVNSNVAAMVADPRDLTNGRTYEDTGSADTSKTQDRWRKREPSGINKPLPTTSMSGGGGGN